MIFSGEPLLTDTSTQAREPCHRGTRQVDGEPVVIILQRGASTWRPHSVVRLTVVGQHIGGIVDYMHCPWVISMAESATVVAHP